MMPLILTVLTASLLGSLHCAGMCGAFVAFAVTGGTADRSFQARLHAAYNVGRLVVYLALGATAGAIGAAVDLTGALVGVQRGAAAVAGSIMVVVGVITLLRLHGVRVAGFGFPKALERWLSAGHRAAAGQTPVIRAASIGLLTTLLPCGWLYAFVITAAGTADPLRGAATMAAFWIGTLPVMLTVGTLARRATGALGAKLPTITAAAVVLVGLVTVWHRVELSELTGRMLTASGAVDPAQQAATINSSDLPCCK